MTMFRNPRILLSLALASCLLAAGLVGAQASPAKTKTYSCGDLPTSKTPAGLKGGYITQIKVTGYPSKSKGCKSGTSLALAYYKCRAAKGIKGSCSGKTINGLKCTEKRGLASPTEYNALVTCKKGSKKVVHAYQQNLS